MMGTPTSLGHSTGNELPKEEGVKPDGGHPSPVRAGNNTDSVETQAQWNRQDLVRSHPSPDGPPAANRLGAGAV
jgi:hypothetical protein